VSFVAKGSQRRRREIIVPSASALGELKKKTSPVGAAQTQEHPMTSDSEFTASLAAYLSQFSEGHKPTVPLFKKDDGSIDRDKTLALPCFVNYPRT
jgi:hypothetical protein